MPRNIRPRQVRSTDWHTLLPEFILFKKAQGTAESTLSEYRRTITNFFQRTDTTLNSDDLTTRVLEYMSGNVSRSTYNNRLTYLKAFFAWLVNAGVHSGNPLTGLKKRRTEGRVVHIEADRLSALIKLPDRKTYAGLRDLALILLTLDTGIRPAEALSLEIADINLEAREVRVRSTVAKNRISRTLPVMPVTAKAIQELIRGRAQTWSEKAPVFCSYEGTRLSRHSWRDRLVDYGKALGIRLTPYDLRHSFALEFLKAGGNVLALQHIMGHSDLNMTKRYVDWLQADIEKQHATASPLNTLLSRHRRIRSLR